MVPSFVKKEEMERHRVKRLPSFNPDSNPYWTDLLKRAEKDGIKTESLGQMVHDLGYSRAQAEEIIARIHKEKGIHPSVMNNEIQCTFKDYDERVNQERKKAVIKRR